MRLSSLLAAVVGYCAVALVIGLSGTDAWLRAVVLLPVALILPGWLTLRVLAPRGAVPLLEGTVYAVASSMSICALGGVAIQLFLGLNDRVWVVFLGLYAVIAAGAWVAKSRGADPEERAITLSVPSVTVGSLLLVAVALSLVAGAMVIASAGATAQRSKAHFAELWVLPAGSSSRPVVTVGVGNSDGEARSYGIVVSRGRDRLLRTRIRLDEGRSWTVDVPVIGLRGTVRARLLWDGEPLRSVHLGEAMLK